MRAGFYRTFRTVARVHAPLKTGQQFCLRPQAVLFHRLPGSQNHKRRPVIHQAGIGSRQQGSHGDFMLL